MMHTKIKSKEKWIVRCLFHFTIEFDTERLVLWILQNPESNSQIQHHKLQVMKFKHNNTISPLFMAAKGKQMKEHFLRWLKWREKIKGIASLLPTCPRKLNGKIWAYFLQTYEYVISSDEFELDFSD